MARETAEWQELTELTREQPFVIERVRLTAKDVAIEGRWALPELARLSGEDQVFVAAFLRSHGSIKEMEQVFGVSYPTVKARLNRIADKLQFVEKVEFVDAAPQASSRAEVLDRLRRGELSADEAVKALEALK
jgi:hypothetical protein